MPLILAALLYWIRLLRRPMDARLKKRQAGNFAVFAIGSSMVPLWLRDAPSDLPTSYVWGELCGVLAVYAMSWSLVLATRARFLEPWFGGLDRMYLRHKQLAFLGMLLLLPHVFVTGKPPGKTDSTVGVALGVASLLGLLALVLISLPRIGRMLRLSYYRWQFVHRLTGLFLAAGIVHGLMIDRVVAASVTLRAVYLVVGAVGLGCYLYEELAMRRRQPRNDYLISSVTRPAADVVELQLTPTGVALASQAGQFVFVKVGGEQGFREHPFSIASVDTNGGLRLSVRALGQDTRRLHAGLTTGTPATLTGPYGMFDYTLGGRRQVWVAGGIGIVPFLSWMQALQPADDYDIDLFYSVPSPDQAIYLPEARAAGVRLPDLRVHPVFSSTQGHLSGAHIADTVSGPLAGLHVFISGPPPMVRQTSRALRGRGVPREHIHTEHFAFL